MASYFYIISSMPMLMPGGACPFSSQDFIRRMEGFASDSEVRQLEELSLVPPAELPEGTHSAVASWYDWETSLRNALMTRRVKKYASESSGIPRQERGCYPAINNSLNEAFGKHSPLETENIVDGLRWARLDELECGHHFDFVRLCTYKLKLMLCEKRAARDIERGKTNFDNISNKIFDSANALAP